jgi:hypothetical protein
MDILKSAIKLMSSRKEDPKPKKPLTLQDLKNFVEYGGGIDKLRVARGTPSKTVKRSEDDLYYGNPRYDLLPQKDRAGSALAGLFPQYRTPILPLINFDNKSKIKGLDKRVAPRFQEQLKYMFDYIQSPKYRERLSKTYDKELEIRKQDPDYKNTSNTYNRNKDGSYTYGYTGDDFRQGIFSQFTDNKALKKRQIDDVISRGIAELMGLTNKGIKFVDEEIRTGDGGTAGAMSFSGGTVFDTNYQKQKNRGSIANYVAGPNGPKDQYGQPLTQVDEDRGYTMPVHEFSHSTTTNDPFSYKFSKAYLQGDKGIMKGGLAPGDSLHSTRSPTELKARIDVIRFLAKKNKIWDAGTTDITDEQLEKLMNHPNIRGNDAMGDVLRAIGKDKNQKKNFKWLLNNIAKNKSNKPSQPDQGSLA